MNGIALQIGFVVRINTHQQVQQIGDAPTHGQTTIVTGELGGADAAQFDLPKGVTPA